MFSGKTEELISDYKKNALANRKTIFINYVADTRYANERESLVCSHDGQKVITLMTKTLYEDPLGIPNDTQVICIDEGQFFGGLRQFCERWVIRGVDIYVAALNGNKDQKIWPNIGEIIPICNKITFKYAVCIVCHDKKATCTRSLIKFDNPDNILIGGDESFVSVCTKCLHVDITPAMIENRRKLLREIKNKLIN
jgi:thymidine kinase